MFDPSLEQFPSVVGPTRHACEFGLMFGDDWTPAHLTGGPTNLYKEIALALKGVAWRKPGLVAVAAKLASSAGPHKPIKFTVPATYEPHSGPNPWTALPKGRKLPPFLGQTAYEPNVGFASAAHAPPTAITLAPSPVKGQGLSASKAGTAIDIFSHDTAPADLDA